MLEFLQVLLLGARVLLGMQRGSTIPVLHGRNLSSWHLADGELNQVSCCRPLNERGRAHKTQSHNMHDDNFSMQNPKRTLIACPAQDIYPGPANTLQNSG